MADAFLAEIGNEFILAINTAGDTFNLDASNDKIAVVFQMPEAMTITVVGFVTTTGGMGTSPIYTWGLQGVDASGLPDGTYVGGGSPASVAEAGTDANQMDDHTLDNSYAAVRGEWLALVGEYSSGTIDGSNFVNIRRGRDMLGKSPGVPYTVLDTAGGGWVKTANSTPIWLIRSASKSLGMPLVNLSINSNDWNSTNETGLRFKLDANWGSSFKLVGAQIISEFLTAGATQYMALYSGASAPYTLEESIAIDGDFYLSTAASLGGRFFFDAATLPTLNHGTEYFLVFMSSSATGRSPWVFEFATVGDAAALPWGGGFQLCTRVVNGIPGSDTADNNFTVTTTMRPSISLILEDWTEPAGGGGGSSSPVIGG